MIVLEWPRQVHTGEVCRAQRGKFNQKYFKVIKLMICVCVCVCAHMHVHTLHLGWSIVVL